MYKKALFPFALLVYVSLILGGIQPKINEFSRPQTKPHLTPPFPADLDGDGITDSVQPESLGLQENISVSLSRNGVVSVLQFAPRTSEPGILSMQDADGDGDVDLLWSSPLHFAVRLVCLNDGYGQFECLTPPTPQVATNPTHEARIKQFHIQCFESLLSAERSPSPDYRLTSQLGVHLVKSFKKWRRQPLLRIASPVYHLPTKRGPPFFFC